MILALLDYNGSNKGNENKASSFSFGISENVNELVSAQIVD